jgi:hypothetical protein
MIKPLRRKHLQIWTGIAVLLPVGMVCAWLVVPKPVKDHLWQPASAVTLPVILKSMKRENYTVSLRTNNDHSSLQLEWINQSASDTIYATSIKIYANTDFNVVSH